MGVEVPYSYVIGTGEGVGSSNKGGGQGRTASASTPGEPALQRRPGTHSTPACTRMHPLHCYL